ncbi:hypothetical protein FXO38_24498 [Capsicum annuum]|nr:hypothetical protein FXO38_24498 [Capsicum annuum]
MAGADVNRPWRNLPYSPGTMAVGGVVVIGGIWYYMTYMKKKPEADHHARVAARDAARGATRPEDTPRK